MNGLQLQFQLRREQFGLDVYLQLPERGVSAIFGRSGSGKTTLLRCIAGLERAPTGRLSIDGEIWQDTNHFTPVHKRAVGYVFQESSLFAHLNVAANLRFGWQRTPAQQRRVDFDEAVALLQLEPLLCRRPEQLSGGQRQRVALARAVLSSPRILLMDEPLASLDLDSKSDILPYLDKLQRHLQIPLLYVSHSPDEVLRIADHMVLLEQGRVRAAGPVNQLLTRTDLPLAHLEEACAVVEGEVVEHDEHYHLTWLALAAGRVAITLQNHNPGHRVRVRILARDVSIARQLPRETSISNILPVQISEIIPGRDPARVLLKLDMGGETLLSQITAKSVDVLQLQVNERVYAQVKSVALMR